MRERVSQSYILIREQRKKSGGAGRFSHHIILCVDMISLLQDKMGIPFRVLK